MTKVIKAGLRVAPELMNFVDNALLPGTGIAPDAFWQSAADIFARFAPRNRELLAVREDLQAQIDAWHLDRKGQPLDQVEYQAFLRQIGYVVRV